MPDETSRHDPRPRIGVVAVTRLSALLGDVIPDFDARADIELVPLGFEEAVRHLRRQHAQRPYDVLIAAGSNGAYLRSRMPVPTVMIRPSGFDLMQALARARAVSARLGVITHAADMPAFADFCRAFDLPIEQRAFVTAEEARLRVSELRSLGIGAVVGTGLTIDLAEQQGLAGILLYSEASARAAFEQALDLSALIDPAAPRAPRATRARGGNRPAPPFVGDSRVAETVRAALPRLAASDATVLLLGESGTGKERVARALHALSPRAGQPFVAVNCGALNESLLEAELFGHEEGAFTGARRGGRPGLIEAAHGGTLLLDEIGEMPALLQTRLLRVLEEREVLRVGATRATPVDLRVIAATHRDVEAAVRNGHLRADLYYRLNVLRLSLPALRERPDDLLPLIAHLQQTLGAPPLPVSDAALAQLRAHPWPGNVRELRNLLERCRVAGATRLEVDTLHRIAPELRRTNPPPPAGGRPGTAALQRRLEALGGNRAALAAELGISRTTLWRWLRT